MLNFAGNGRRSPTNIDIVVFCEDSTGQISLDRSSRKVIRARPAEMPLAAISLLSSFNTLVSENSERSMPTDAASFARRFQCDFQSVGFALNTAIVVKMPLP